jgi:uncharacterized protein
MSGARAHVGKIDLRALRAERGAALVVTCRETVASHIDDIPFPEPVEGTLTLVNRGPTLHVEGRLHTRVELVCDRCTSRFPYRLEADVSEEFHWDPADSPDEGGTAETGEFLIRAGESVFLDVEGLAREALVLALPMVARCSEECQGLCPRCGADLRSGPCGCIAEEEADVAVADPRLWPLTRLSKDHLSSGSAG